VMGQGEFQRREGQLISARADANESNNRLKLLGMTAPDIAALERSQTIKSHIPILAPLSGRIIGRNVTKGEVVETTRHLFTIADLATIWVVASVSEQDFAFIHRNVHEAMTAEVLLTAYPNQPIVGKVTYVGDVLDPDTRTLALRIEMANPDGRLKPEMFATVRIQAPDEPDVIAVPSMAIQRDRGQTVVFVQLNDDEFSRRIVELGDRNGDHVRVMNGLQEGDRVVVDGAYVVKSEFANQHRGGVAE
ncbi:MAG: efflux RND transporter periplasmic adaptor subunit, partial [Nitrospira sp.]|nr:efflux RND transporter periplasmic adaptor subunit [Nitrospira sp.]